MSRTFTDDDLLTWEAYSSGSRRAADKPAIIFRCLSDRAARARYVETDGDGAYSQRLVNTVAVAELRAMLARAQPLP